MDITNIICTVITASSGIIMAYIADMTKKSKAAEAKKEEQRKKEEEERLKEALKREKRRREEMFLSLQMASANSALTVGVAWALKRGHCNGEVEEGLRKVAEAEEAYKKFMQEVVVEEIK